MGNEGVFIEWACLHDDGQCADILRILYENTPMQNTVNFGAVKIENFQMKTFDIFLIFAQNIDCGYTLVPPRRGASNE